MFCSNCGQQLNENANFCFNCGEKVSKFSNRETKQIVSNNQNQNNDIFDRKALLIYLTDIVRLEFSIHKLNQIISNIQCSTDRIKGNYYKKINVGANSEYGKPDFIHFLYNGTNYFFLQEKWKINFDEYIRVYAEEKINWNSWHKVSWEDIEKSNKVLKDLKSWDDFAITASMIFKKSRKRQVMTKFFEAYEIFRKEAPIYYSKNMQIVKENSRKIEELSKDLKQAHTILDSYYKLNLLPSQYRNIYAVHYLADYMGTSQETLEMAFLHMDLKEIKNKLDKIISNQESIILSLAALESKNSKLIEDNKKQLTQLACINENTVQAANYTAIAANYAKTSAFFSTASFIQNYCR